MICEPFIGSAVNDTSAVAVFRKHCAMFELSDSRKWLDAFLADLERGKSSDHASPGESFIWPEGRKRIVFLGQCYTDSSVLFGARDGASTLSIVRSLIQYAANHSVFVLAKLHPKENGGLNPLEVPYDKLTWRKLVAAGICSRSEGGNGDGRTWLIDHENEINTAALLQNCDAVVTINSQGGLEALAHGKRVLLLGNAFYSNVGLTIDVPALTLLPAALDDVLSDQSPKVDIESVTQFLRIYFQDYCIERVPRAFVGGVRDRLRPDGAFVRAFNAQAVSTEGSC
jgi:hypothetical protein